MPSVDHERPRVTFAHIVWARQQRAGGLAEKSVLFALADFADDTGRAWPSAAALAERCEMNEKTVTVALRNLVRRGLIVDTGERKGATKQVRVYGLVGTTKVTQKRMPSASQSHPKLVKKAPQKRGTEYIKENINNGPIDPAAAAVSKEQHAEWFDAHGLPDEAEKLRREARELRARHMIGKQ